MPSTPNAILTINGGSSSIKFSLYSMDGPSSLLFHGQIERIGTNNSTLSFDNHITHQKSSILLESSKNIDAPDFLIHWMERQDWFASVRAVGHRIVYGMKHTEPKKITPELLSELKSLSAFDTEHLPEEVKLIEAFSRRYPDLTHVACFDTAFHTSMPPVAKLLAIPRRYTAMGIKRYGYHGLSYAYLMDELTDIAGASAARGRVILAHLGSGASIAAVRDGKSIDTSMGFTPASGLPMGTRTGDLDPGVYSYLMQREKLSPQRFDHMINHESGMLGISETSSDMRELLQAESTDIRAAEAVELFCYQIKKWIGAYAAALGGLDTLVFSGGIGENAPQVRERICRGLEFLGIEIDPVKNANNEAIISTPNSKTCVRVIRTNEELMIAKLSLAVLDGMIKN